MFVSFYYNFGSRILFFFCIKLEFENSYFDLEITILINKVEELALGEPRISEL